MNRRIFFATLVGFAAGLLCAFGKKHRPTVQYRPLTKGEKARQIALILKSQAYPSPENGYKWDIEWPPVTLRGPYEIVVDKAVYRNGHIRNN